MSITGAGTNPGRRAIGRDSAAVPDARAEDSGRRPSSTAVIPEIRDAGPRCRSTTSSSAFEDDDRSDSEATACLAEPWCDCHHARGVRLELLIVAGSTTAAAILGRHLVVSDGPGGCRGGPSVETCTSRPAPASSTSSPG
ncbi:SflA family class IV lanthipeptide [Kitasatospora albolonga]|uniref:SflA family class IV lanthipeptide n=1 Tax=Kitasatospora albolonga TaxID=68173 RepID=UPI0031E95941